MNSHSIDVVVVITYMGGGVAVLGGRGVSYLPWAPLNVGENSREVANRVVRDLFGFDAEPWGLLTQVGFIDRKAGSEVVLYAAALPEKPPFRVPVASWISYNEVAEALPDDVREFVFASAHFKG